MYLETNLILIVDAECVDQVLFLGHLTLAHVHEYRVGLQDVVEVRVDLVAPRYDFVLVAGDLEAMAAFLEPHYSYVC
jgi:hypothetical protein